jgi:hypothetical protein
VARRADPVEFNDVTNLSETESFADVVRPRLEFRRVDFDGRAAEPTREVVMVGFDDTTPVETLAPIGHHDVDLSVLEEFLELRVDGRERDVAAVAPDEGVQFLGADESLDLAQNPDDFPALDRVS